MSRENVETTRKGMEAFNRRDFDAALASLHDEVTWERFLSRAEAATPLVRGKEELRHVWESQVEALDLRIEPEEFISIGEKVIVPTQVIAQGSGSDITLTGSVTWVYSFERGVVTRVEGFETPDDALRGVQQPD
jgi:ketosteroid isomerase-like protein